MGEIADQVKALWTYAAAQVAHGLGYMPIAEHDETTGKLRRSLDRLTRELMTWKWSAEGKQAELAGMARELAILKDANARLDKEVKSWRAMVEAKDAEIADLRRPRSHAPRDAADLDESEAPRPMYVSGWERENTRHGLDGRPTAQKLTIYLDANRARVAVSDYETWLDGGLRQALAEIKGSDRWFAT